MIQTHQNSWRQIQWLTTNRLIALQLYLKKKYLRLLLCTVDVVVVALTLIVVCESADNVVHAITTPWTSSCCPATTNKTQ